MFAEMLELEEFSSEGEEDRRHPTSLRAIVKRASASGQASLESAMASLKLEEDPRPEKPCSLATSITPVEKLCRELQALSLNVCKRCGHSFGLRRTLVLHERSCR